MLNPKSEYRNPKQFSNFQNPNDQNRFVLNIRKLEHSDLLRISDFVLRILIALSWCVVFGIFSSAYALNIDKVKVYFLEGDYKSAILEGEKLLAGEAQSARSDELYYILGLSYLKDGNYLRASDIFEIILKEFKNSAFKEETSLGLGDTYFLKGDYDQAEGYFRELINNNPATKLKALGYYRLSLIGFKKGDTQQGQEYLEKLKKEFPASTELLLNRELATLPSYSADFSYTVQVGSFSELKNARNLSDKLIKSGYDAYIEEADLRDAKTYRVKVGKLKSRAEAVQLQNKLSQAGYPTRICP